LRSKGKPAHRRMWHKPARDGDTAVGLRRVWAPAAHAPAAREDLALLRRMAVPLAAYLLLAPTLHPWYVMLLLPFLPLLPAGDGSPDRNSRLMWAAIYGSWTVSLSYLLYLTRALADAYYAVVAVEFLPLYALLIWAVWPRRETAAEGDGGHKASDAVPPEHAPGALL